jgi:hypothetical protein
LRLEHVQRAHVARRHTQQQLAIADAYQNRALACAERQLCQQFETRAAGAAADGTHASRQPRGCEHRGQHHQ